MADSIRKRELWWFIVVSFAWSWLFWTPVMLTTFGFINTNLVYPSNWFYDFIYGQPLTAGHWFTVIGGFGPIVGALLVTWRFRDRAAVRDLWRRVFDVRRMGLVWFLVALLLIPVTMGLGALLGSLISGIPMQFGTGPLAGATPLTVILAFLYSVATMTVLIVCEEMGWRGFMLPRLQADRSALMASIWVAVAWAYWHFPYYLILFSGGDYSMSGLQSALWATLLSPIWLIMLSTIFTFVYNSTRGSLLAVMILHGSNNSSARLFGLDPDQAAEASQQSLGLAGLAPIIVSLLLFVGVILIFGKTNLSKLPRQVIE